MPRIVLAWILLFAAVGIAQEEGAIPIPIDYEGETESAGGRSFVDDVFHATRNHFGFSVSAYQAYTTDVSRVGEPNRDAGITSVMPRAFFNAGRRRSQFHFDLGAGYRMYNRERSFNSWDYFANAQYRYELSTRTSLQISDQFTSSYNDSWSFVSLYSPIRHNPGFSNELLFNRQRITRNAAVAQLNSQITRKARLGVFGGYNSYKYAESTLGNASAIEAGAEFDYRLNRWLYLASRYSTYLNYVDDRFRDTQIHRLQFAGVDFNLTRSWRAWMTAGAEASRQQERYRVSESIDAGLGYNSYRSTFSLTYQHGFTAGIGISRLLRSDVFSGNFGYRANRWLSGNLQSYYYRSRELEGSGKLETISFGGGLQFALRRDLIASASSYYQHQRTRDFSIDGLGLSRLTAYVGLQYVWPSLSN